MSQSDPSDVLSMLSGLHGAAVDPASVPLSTWPAQSGESSSEGADLQRYESRESPTAALTQLPEIVVYEHINFGGASWRTNLNYLFVGRWWNDRISSIVVVRGRWRFYQHINYGGAYWDLRQGYYPWVEAANIPNDIISSFKFIGW